VSDGDLNRFCLRGYGRQREKQAEYRSVREHFFLLGDGGSYSPTKGM
jgi:hypothetical protein